MRLVIPSWLVGSSAIQFEIMNPLLECIARVRALGSQVPIDIPFLIGFQELRPSWLEDIRHHGGNIFDASDLTEKFRHRLPRFSAVYEAWGTIRDLCIIRHFVMEEMGISTPFIFMDNDIILNANPENLGQAYAGMTFLAEGSPCFGFVSDTGWLKTICDYTCLLHDDPISYARAVGFNGNIGDLSDPVKSLGSDQMITRHLIAAGILKTQSPKFYCSQEEYILAPSWFSFDRVGSGLQYKRIDNRDTVDGKIVAISHLHKDFLNYLGTFAFVEEITGLQGFGRIPPPAYLDSDDLPGSGVLKTKNKILFSNSLANLHSFARSKSKSPLPFDKDPYSRRNAIRRFYEEGDFSAVFNDRTWWKAGVWK